MLLDPRTTYKPFEYPEFFNFMKSQYQAFWLPEEVPMGDDVNDYNNKLTPEEKNLIINILRFFPTSDAEVMDNYNTSLIPHFPKPEVTMMLTAFASQEVIHTFSYAHLNDTLGLPDEEYSAFKEYEEMRNKFDLFHLHKLGANPTPRQLAKNLAVFGGFIEGVSLFASFCILMNFPRRNLMKGVGQIVSWSVLDEGVCHSEGICSLFRTLTKEYKLLDKELKSEIYTACEDIVKAEDLFIDKCFEMGAVSGLKPEQVKDYIRYMANYRLKALGLKHIYKIKENPLPWMDAMMSGKEHANFFETRATDYSKGVIKGDWE